MLYNLISYLCLSPNINTKNQINVNTAWWVIVCFSPQLEKFYNTTLLWSKSYNDGLTESQRTHFLRGNFIWNWNAENLGRCQRHLLRLADELEQVVQVGSESVRPTLLVAQCCQRLCHTKTRLFCNNYCSDSNHVCL